MLKSNYIVNQLEQELIRKEISLLGLSETRRGRKRVIERTERNLYYDTDSSKGKQPIQNL